VAEGRLRIVIAGLALFSALALVAWRQGRALEAHEALEETRKGRVLAEARRLELERRIEFLESRAHVAPAAKARLGMRTPEAGEMVFIAGTGEES
jgi:cell division protein FtsL